MVHTTFVVALRFVVPYYQDMNNAANNTFSFTSTHTFRADAENDLVSDSWKVIGFWDGKRWCLDLWHNDCCHGEDMTIAEVKSLRWMLRKNKAAVMNKLLMGL